MKFTISSSELLHGLLAVSRVIAAKNSLPILDNFLFILKDDLLEITASDLEITLKTTVKVDNTEQDGEIAVPAKLLTDTLREFSEQPLTFEVNSSENIVEISWMNGAAQIPFFSADDYPAMISLSDVAINIDMPSQVLLSGIVNTLYATADEELRPVMNGILFDISTDNITLVASDAHKLVCYKRKDITSQENTSFILPKKTASILKNLLPKIDDNVKITFDHKNVTFSFDNTYLVSRLVEGNYPPYKAVIPQNNRSKLTIGRVDLLNSAKRVAVCANQATSYIRMQLSFNQLIVSAQDLSFSIAAHETLSCQYDGNPLDLGFKSTFLVEILNNLHTDEVLIKLEEPNKAVLILPEGEQDPNEEITALLMPILINA